MATKFTEMKKRIEVLERLDKELDNIARDTFCSYECIEEIITDEQDTDWRTGELIWEDEEKTIPKMRVNRKYDYVPRPDAELDEGDRAVQKAIEDVRKALLKMI